MKKSLLLISLILLVFVSQVCAQEPTIRRILYHLSLKKPSTYKQDAYPVTRVIDGDTIVVNQGGKDITVRLIGIDTPETVHPQKPVQHYGKEASRFTENLLKSESVYLITEANQPSIDPNGHTLAYVFRAPHGLFVNAEIIRQGYGHAYTKFPFKMLKEFKELQRFAEKAGKGLWKPVEKKEVTKRVSTPPVVKKSQRTQKNRTERTSVSQLRYNVVESKMLNDARVISITTAQFDRAKDIAMELVNQNKSYYMVRVFLYEPGKDLATIRYEWTESQGLVKSFDRRTPAPRKDRDPTLPKYEVLSRIKQYMGNKRIYGDVLIASFSRTTPVKKREQVAHAICMQERLDDISLYSTRDAYEANMSESYSNSHPGALKKGFLGSLSNGKFVAGEVLWP